MRDATLTYARAQQLPNFKQPVPLLVATQVVRLLVDSSTVVLLLSREVHT